MMSDTCKRSFCTILCKILAIALMPWVGGIGCSMDKGSSGEIPRPDVLLEAEGCLAENADQDQAGTLLFSVFIPFDLSLMEARLEVLRGDVDLVVGTEEPPSDYFSLGRGTGTQKILVGRASNEPLMARTWYVQLVSPFGIQEECETGVGPDWRLSVRRSAGIQGRLLVEQEGEVPACTPIRCASELLEIEVPEDALSMELLLETIQGDVDLLVGIEDQPEGLASLNTGTGYDAIVVDPDICLPLRGQALPVSLESWQQPSEYRLEVAYVAGVRQSPDDSLPP